MTTGGTPGGRVVFFSVARETEHFVARVVPRSGVATGSAAVGEARFELERDVPWQSVWVAVDLATGAFDVAVPEGFELRVRDLPPRALATGPDGVDQLTDTRLLIEALLVRPPKGNAPSGAWVGTVGDGGVTDADERSNGTVVLPLLRLRPLGDSPDLLPPVFTPNDVLAVIDPNSLEVYVSQLVSGSR